MGNQLLANPEFRRDLGLRPSILFFVAQSVVANLPQSIFVVI
jgi:hypothetical protein